jgi:uncharacterized protein YqeY
MYNDQVGSTQSRLEEDLKEAMRGGREIEKRTLRQALSEVKYASVSRNRPLNEEEVLTVLRKEIQARKEVIGDAGRVGRTELVEQAEDEIAVLERYLPATLSADELEYLAKQAIDEVGAVNVADTGKVMKVLRPRLQGRVPGGEANQVVRDLLGSDG